MMGQRDFEQGMGMGMAMENLIPRPRQKETIVGESHRLQGPERTVVEGEMRLVLVQQVDVSEMYEREINDVPRHRLKTEEEGVRKLIQRLLELGVRPRQVTVQSLRELGWRPRQVMVHFGPLEIDLSRWPRHGLDPHRQKLAGAEEVPRVESDGAGSMGAHPFGNCRESVRSGGLVEGEERREQLLVYRYLDPPELNPPQSPFLLPSSLPPSSLSPFSHSPSSHSPSSLPGSSFVLSPNSTLTLSPLQSHLHPSPPHRQSKARICRPPEWSPISG